MADLRKTPPPSPGQVPGPAPGRLRRWLPLAALAFLFYVAAAGVAVLVDDGGTRTAAMVVLVLAGFTITSFISVQVARQNGTGSSDGGGSDGAWSGDVGGGDSGGGDSGGGDSGGGGD